ncbi:MAG: hypothetical protein ACLQQ4_15585 [Bacteroidia bacterium]
MANPNKPKGKAPAANPVKKKPPVYKEAAKTFTLFENLDNWFDKRAKPIATIIFICSALFSVLLFQARMDIGGDDSAYLQRAYDFVHKGIFPAFQGPLYPMVLSIFIAPFGINIILLKSLSLIFNIIGLYFFYKAFKGRIPSFIFYPVFFIAAINSYILNFASLTYNEAFFMCIQYIFFYYFFILIDKLKEEGASSIKENYRNWLMPGLLIFSLILTRNIAITCLGGIVLFFILNKQYLNSIYIVGAFLVFELPMLLIQKLLLHSESQWASQGGILLLKDPYDASKGKENLSGFFSRFFQNCDIYVSKRFFEILGFRSEEGVKSYKPFEPDNLNWFVLLLIILVVFIIYRLVKSKNKYMLVTFLYALSISATSFFVLQTRWDQPRLIMVYVPAFLMAIFYAFYDLFKKGPWGLQFLLFATIGVFTFAGVGATLSKAKKNMPILKKNLEGDILYGYTPDWVNYLKMSRWCADSLPKDANIAARKAPMSFIYANGKEFFPVYKVYSTNADSLLAYFKTNKVNYIMLPNLRITPDKNTGEIITTMQYMIKPIYDKYPQRLRFIHREGTDEVTDLYQILY